MLSNNASPEEVFDNVESMLVKHDVLGMILDVVETRKVFGDSEEVFLDVEQV